MTTTATNRSLRICAALLASLATAGCLTPTPPASAEATTAIVLRAVDGDTFDLKDDHRGRIRVRVLGINTPENTTTTECGGPEATQFATTTLVGKRVAVITDPSQDLHDRYGRTLAYLKTDAGWDYSIEAARSGIAQSRTYGKRPVQQFDAITAAENDARAQGKGIWGPPCWTEHREG